MFVAQSMVLLQSPISFTEIFSHFFTVYAKPHISYEVLAYGWCAKSNFPFLQKKIVKIVLFIVIPKLLFFLFFDHLLKKTLDEIRKQLLL